MTKLHVDLFIEVEDDIVSDKQELAKELQQVLSNQLWIKNFNFTTIGD